MALTKQDWYDHYEASEKIEGISQLIIDCQEEIDDLHTKRYERACYIVEGDPDLQLRYGHIGDWDSDTVDKVLADANDNPFMTEIEALEADIVDYEEKIKELRKDTIPTTREGDSVESLQDEFYPPPRRPEF